MKISVDIYNPKKTAKRIFSNDVRIYANTRLHAYCSPYVPMDSESLDQTVDITPDYVHYKSPYAHYQYEGEVYGPNFPIDMGGGLIGFYSPPTKYPTGRKLNYSNDKHPLATSRWDKTAMAAKGDQLANDIEAYIGRK